LTQEYIPPKEVKSCPIDNTFKIIGKKFTVHLIRDMYSNTLATRLKEMEKGKLIKKRIFHETPIRIEYSLTDKGKDLIPILEQMAAYSLKHAPEIFFDKKTRSYQEVCGRNPASL